MRWVELRQVDGEEPQSNYRLNDSLPPPDAATPARPRGFGGNDPDGGLFVFADGRVRLISEAIDPGVLAAPAKRSGREFISSKAF